MQLFFQLYGGGTTQTEKHEVIAAKGGQLNHKELTDRVAFNCDDRFWMMKWRNFFLILPLSENHP